MLEFIVYDVGHTGPLVVTVTDLHNSMTVDIFDVEEHEYDFDCIDLHYPNIQDFSVVCRSGRSVDFGDATSLSSMLAKAVTEHRRA